MRICVLGVFRLPAVSIMSTHQTQALPSQKRKSAGTDRKSRLRDGSQVRLAHKDRDSHDHRGLAEIKYGSDFFAILDSRYAQ